MEEAVEEIMKNKKFQDVVQYYEHNRQRGKDYYERNKEAVLARKAARYNATHDLPPPGSRGRPRKIINNSSEVKT